MTIPSTNGGGAATNVPVKPLRREGIRCKKLSRGSRSYPGIETIPAAGLSAALARAGLLFGRPRPLEVTHADFADGTGALEQLMHSIYSSLC